MVRITNELVPKADFQAHARFAFKYRHYHNKKEIQKVEVKFKSMKQSYYRNLFFFHYRLDMYSYIHYSNIEEMIKFLPNILAKKITMTIYHDGKTKNTKGDELYTVIGVYYDIPEVVFSYLQQKVLKIPESLFGTQREILLFDYLFSPNEIAVKREFIYKFSETDLNKKLKQAEIDELFNKVKGMVGL